LGAKHNRVVAILASVFFVSGFSALLYQVVWQRMLGLFTGSDVRSVTIVTGAYLGGLGVGSLIGSAYADRLSSRGAVRAYALCNLGIATFAVLSRFFFYDLLFQRLSPLADSPVVMLITVFISLLWPTILMGLSLPLLSKALVRNIAGAARLISTLYGLNTLGAGVGAFVAGWFLIGALGYEQSVYLGAALSALVGVVAWISSSRLSADDKTPAQSPGLNLNLANLPRSVRVWCALVFTSGFIVISLELVWFRVLDFMLKSNAYTFGHLLALFLVGDALGSLAGSRAVKNIANPRRAFLWIQGIVALYALISLWLLSN
jgi:MFS family permease